MGSVVDLLETRYYYSGIFILTYSYFLFSSITHLQTEKIALFPNLLIFSFVFLSGLTMSLAIQEFNHQDVRIRQIVSELFSAIIPFLLLSQLIKGIVARERSKQNDELFILGLNVIRGILIILSIIYSLIFILILVLGYNPSVWFLLWMPVLGLTGFELGTYLSKIRENPSNTIQKIQAILAITIGSRKRRIITSSINFLLIIFFNILDKYLNFKLIEI